MEMLMFFSPSEDLRLVLGRAETMWRMVWRKRTQGLLSGHDL